ncbi:beta-glucosidase family protein [Halocatena halophila]|uniref:beta-glucosidase family protein n=1 Tax=Halocatena halophila TaxID=2814576 RepID=UPI002ED64573
MSTPPDRLDDLVESMTREEKLRLVRGTVLLDEGRATGYLPSIDRLDLPSLKMVDGPLGVRLDEATAFPASIALGATFDPALATAFGEAIGAETRAKGIDVLLAPGCNLIRTPHCGRNFEYYGEDPYHSGALVSATIEGIQSQGVGATVKHYVANNQEHDRTEVSAAVDSRALRELYCRPFEAAVNADVAAVMAAYNRINGTYATEHEALLTDVLKDEFGFDGPVMSDWYAVNNGLAAARAGTDLEMPGVGVYEMLPTQSERLTLLAPLDEWWPDSIPGPDALVNAIARRASTSRGGIPNFSESKFAAELEAALETDSFSPERLDAMVRRVLTLYTRGDRSNESTGINANDHRSLARTIATRGTVLLKNDGVLPLSADTDVAVIGPNVTTAKVGGGGSSEVNPSSTVDPADGIRNRASGSVTVAQGHPPIDDPSIFSIDIGSKFFGETESTDIQPAIDAATAADVAVVVVQDVATEARDRPSLELPGEQNQLIQTIAANADRTVVVVQASGPVALPWIESVNATLCSWYPGQEAGSALGAVLFGDVDPGGRLPVTFGREGTYPTSAQTSYPGVSGNENYPVAQYDEDVFIGYRWFDDHERSVQFPFGHGLSYAQFEYRSLSLGEGNPPESATVTVSNTADRSGREVIQLYVEPEDPAVDRPPRELAGFMSVELPANTEHTYTIDLDERAFAYYDDENGWTIDDGSVTVAVARSSRNTQLRTETVISAEQSEDAEPR